MCVILKFIDEMTSNLNSRTKIVRTIIIQSKLDLGIENFKVITYFIMNVIPQVSFCTRHYKMSQFPHKWNMVWLCVTVLF